MLPVGRSLAEASVSTRGEREVSLPAGRSTRFNGPGNESAIPIPRTRLYSVRDVRGIFERSPAARPSQVGEMHWASIPTLAGPSSSLGTGQALAPPPTRAWIRDFEIPCLTDYGVASRTRHRLRSLHGLVTVSANAEVASRQAGYLPHDLRLLLGAAGRGISRHEVGKDGWEESSSRGAHDGSRGDTLRIRWVLMTRGNRWAI
jgi:hypothetical protein